MRLAPRARDDMPGFSSVVGDVYVDTRTVTDLRVRVGFRHQDG
ncbi:hypothetical protein [Microtetraspora sp. NBRC 16547]|nr:hypothetical protein [Microtetraspora sp. NBRC 16547]